MYHALLTNRYLTSRVIPLIAVAAVAMCVALVIIVVSVMTGFLDMVKRSGRTLMGDVVVSYAVSGIPYYDRLIDRINKLPEAAAATPVVDGLGILRMPYPADAEKRSEGVQFWGIEPRSFAAVTGYENTLHWRKLSEAQWHWLLGDVLSRNWKDVFAWLPEDERVHLLQRALADPNDPSTAPSEQVIRERLSSISEEVWQQLITSLSREPQTLKAALTTEQWQKLVSQDSRLQDSDAVLQDGLSLQHDGDNRAIVMGMHVSELNVRQHDGSYMPVGGGRWWMPRFQVTLTTLPVSGGSVGGADSAESRILQVVNEFVSGVFLIDDKRVMVPISIAQSMLHLDQSERLDDPDNPFRVTGVQPARATMVLVRAAPGVTPEQLRDAVQTAYVAFSDEISLDPSATMLPPAFGFGLTIQTWAQQQASFIGPVEKEREMMRTLFSLVYLVCAGLVLAIFWAIVYEKTRDIGILRSIGASRMGISWIFLRYGLVVGVLGAIAGLGLGNLVVHNINVIHEALGNPPLTLAVAILALAGITLIITIIRALGGRFLPIVLGGLVFVVLTVLGLLALWLWKVGGFIMWDPTVYYFTRIPNELDVNNAVITMIGAVVFSVIGAFLPAAKAADTDPVTALRYE